MGHSRFRSIDVACGGEPTIAGVRKVGFTLLMITLGAWVVAGCGSGQPAASTSASTTPVPQVITELPATTTIAVGQTIEVVLEENRSTGYSWSTVPPLVKPGAQPVVNVGESTYVAGAQMPGAPGESRTTITAVSPGTAVVVFRYSPPNQQPDLNDIKRLTIVVK